MPTLENTIRTAADSARKWRHALHAHPELALHETETSRMLAAILKDLGWEVHGGIAGTGLVALLGEGQRCLGLRCELDALAMHEANTFAHRSCIAGRMHGCGHDGHMAMLAGAAMVLAQTHDRSKGRICLIFQPAEENEGGARRMIDEGLLDRFPLSAIYALHNWPALPTGTFGLRPGAIMAAFDRFELRILARGAHAAQPQNGSDAILAQASIVQSLHAMQSRKNPMDAAVLSVTSVNGGQTYNVLPEEVSLKGTLRTFDPLTRDALLERTRHILAGAEMAHDVRIEMHLDQGYPATVNREQETELARQAALDTVGVDRVEFPVRPDTGSEDFSCFLEKVPGSYVWLGNGPERGALHNPRYDFNDENLATGIAFWVNLTRLHFGGESHDRED